MPTFPVDLRTYLRVEHMEQQVFDLGEGLAVQNRTAGGEVIRSGGAARLWFGRVVLLGLNHEDARAFHARLHALRGAGASFYIGDLSHRGPTITASLSGVQANGTVNISGGPANAVIGGGDYLSFNYGNRRALHQIIAPTTLDGSGARSGIEVIPPVRPGWSGGTSATIGAAKCLGVMIPGTVRVGTSSKMATDGATFEWVQTLRPIS